MLIVFMNQEKIENWLIDKLENLLGIDSEKIDLEKSIFAYGLDSSVALSVTSELETFVNLELDPTLLWEYPIISELAEYLVDELTEK